VASQYRLLDNIQEVCKGKGAVVSKKKTTQEVDPPPLEVGAVVVNVKQPPRGEEDDAVAVGVKIGANQEFVVKAVKVLDSSLLKCHIKINTTVKVRTLVKLMSMVNLMDVVHLCIPMGRYLKESGRRGIVMKWMAYI
jgi:hypothetical protein